MTQEEQSFHYQHSLIPLSGFSFYGNTVGESSLGFVNQRNILQRLHPFPCTFGHNSALSSRIDAQILFWGPVGTQRLLRKRFSIQEQHCRWRFDHRAGETSPSFSTEMLINVRRRSGLFYRQRQGKKSFLGRGVVGGEGGDQFFTASGKNSSPKPDSLLKRFFSFFFFFLMYHQTVMLRCFSHVSRQLKYASREVRKLQRLLQS